MTPQRSAFGDKADIGRYEMSAYTFKADMARVIKIGGTIVKIRIEIQWDVKREWDTTSY
jgi:hypothetical protein